MFDETFHAAETLREREQMTTLEEAASVFEPTAELGADDAPEAAVHLALRKFVMRMVRQTRIDHTLDLRMLLQKLRDGERVGAVPLHAQSQRLDAAQRQEGIERPGHSAHGVLQIGEPFAQLIGAMPDHRRAADRVRMTVQILRRRVHDEIEPVLQRVLQVRRRERVVTDGHDAAALRHGCDGAEVDDRQQWIGRRFHPDHPRVRP